MNGTRSPRRATSVTSAGALLGAIVCGAAALLSSARGADPAAKPAPPAAEAALPETVSFNRDIRPILSDTCFKCHGPDKAKRKAKLGLDTFEDATADLGDYRAIVPGEPAKSEALTRIVSKDPDEQMPPPDSHLTLTPRQKELFKRWIEQGAKYEAHWSFIPPARPKAPVVKDGKWGRNGIDAFILSRLEGEGLTPSPEASKETLIRRVTLDLTGLPPTPKEVDDFLADASPDAYEKVVDRLLASPAYGERMALQWLDAARYADTSGYQADWERHMWPWRDWAIRAFNNNMPFDQFTVEQMAGDMLPNATTEQRLATGFNRNHRINEEGGIIPEEYAVEYVVDRVDTNSTVFLGLTVGCARCHDHKYDPISQKEFYELYAFFNNVPENGKDGRAGYAEPYLRVLTTEAEQKVAELRKKAEDLETQLAADTDETRRRQAEWELATLARMASGPGGLASSQGGWFLPPIIRTGSDRYASLRPIEDGSILATEDNPETSVYDVWLAPAERNLTALRLDVLTHETLPKGSVGRGNGNFVLTEVEVEAIPADATKPDAGGEKPADVDPKSNDAKSNESVASPAKVARIERGQPVSEQVKLVTSGKGKPVKIKTAAADYAQAKWPIKDTIDGKQTTGWAVDGHVKAVDRAAVFVFDKPLAGGRGTVLRVRLKQQSVHKYHTIGRFKLSLTTAPEQEAVASVDAGAGLPATVLAAVKVAPDKRTDAQRQLLASHFRSIDPARASLREEIQSTKRQAQDLADTGTPVMVMREMTKPRDTYLLKRGAYDAPDKTQKLAPAIPAALGGTPKDLPRNRLGFAKWLVDRSNPLTARVTVNRFWQMYFGTGIVKTSEDFGAQGEWPSHPELLDWLAVEFMDGGWDVKAVQKRIVTSSTYRQSSRVTPALLEKDPDNRLLARGPRFRLEAQTIRDTALAAAGLLSRKIGGPSVKPYQPAGLWEELAFTDKTTVDKYVQDKGESLYRRGMYIFWKRSVPPPGMMVFDAAGREACSVRLARTNTPLQALTLLNDITYVEAARAMAQRMMTEGGATSSDRLAYGWRLATARKPTDRELSRLVQGFEKYKAKYAADPAAAKALLGVGESKRDETLDPGEHAAYAAVANVLLNLDEAITKE